MTVRRPLVVVSGLNSELPTGDTVAGVSSSTLIAGSGLNGGGLLDGSAVTLNVSLAPAASGLIFVGDALGIDGVAQTTAEEALASGNFALVDAAIALASGNAALADLPNKFDKSGGVISGDVTLNAQSDLRFADADSSNWVALQGPSAAVSDVTWTLPSGDGSASQVLTTDGAGSLSWASISSSSSSQARAYFFSGF